MTKTPADIQRGFVTLFFLSLTADLLASIALASGDEVWAHLSMLWFGPLDDIFFGLLGVQATLFLLDPGGAQTQEPSGGGASLSKVWTHVSSGQGVGSGFAQRYVQGIRKVFILLPAALIAFLLLSFFVSNPVVKGAILTSYRHLAYLVPVSVALGLLISLLSFARELEGFWKGTLMATLCLCLVAGSDGRWHNHFYHLFANLENVHAWMVSLAWAGTFAVLTEGKPQESPVGRVPALES